MINNDEITLKETGLWGGPSSKSTRVLRGGRWDGDVQYCRVLNRLDNPTETCSRHQLFPFGFPDSIADPSLVS